MVILVLGKGCKKCAFLEENAQKAVDSLDMKATIKKITDINEIADYGVMKTPGLVINDRVVSQGKVLSSVAIEKIIRSVE